MKKDEIIETPYVKAPRQHLEALRDLLRFAGLAYGGIFDSRKMDIVSYRWTEAMKPNIEIISNQRFSLNPDLFHFSIISFPRFDYNEIEKNVLQLFFQNYSGERHQNPFVSGLNFEDGIDNLVKMLKTNIVCVRNPPVRQTGTDRIFYDDKPRMIIWDPFKEEFMSIRIGYFWNEKFIPITYEDKEARKLYYERYPFLKPSA